VLHQIGVRPERAVVTLAATVGLTPLKIVLMAIEAKSNAAGYLRRRIEAGAIDPRGGWNAQQIAAAVRRGWLRSLDGYSLDGPETEVKPFPEGLAVYGRGGERIGQISTARLRELAGGLTDAQRRGEGHKRGGQRSADEKARRDDRIQERTHAERLERWEYFNGLSIPRRKRLLQRATIEAAVKTPEAIGEIAIRIAWQERHDTVVAGMDEYDEQTEV